MLLNELNSQINCLDKDNDYNEIKNSLDYLKNNLFKKWDNLKSEELKYIEKIEILSDIYYNYYINENEIYESFRNPNVNSLFFERLESLNKIFDWKNKILNIEKNIVINMETNEASKYNILRNSINDNYSKIKSSFLMKLYEYSYYNFNSLVENRKFNKIKKFCKYLSEEENKSNEIVYIYYNIINKDFIEILKKYFIGKFDSNIVYFSFNYYFSFILKTINKLWNDKEFKINFFNNYVFNLVLEFLSLLKIKLNNELEGPVEWNNIFKFILFILKTYYTQKEIYKKLFLKNFKNYKFLYFEELKNFNRNYFRLLFNKIVEYENEFNYFSKKNNQFLFIKDFTNCIKKVILSNKYLFLDNEIKEYLLKWLNFYINLVNYYDTDNYILLLKIEELLKEILYLFDSINYNDSKILKIITKNSKFIIELINKEFKGQFDKIEDKKSCLKIKLDENFISIKVRNIYLNNII